MTLSEDLQAQLARRLAGLADVTEDTIPAVTGPGPAPLAPAQQRLWYQQELEPDSVEYNIAQVLELTGPLDVDRLRAAVAALVAGHESLRTVFVEQDGVARQQVLPPSTVDLELVEVTEDEVAAHVQAEALAPFDLRAAPPVRFRLLRTGTRHLLLLGVHHIVTDGTSLRLLAEQLCAHYAGTPVVPAEVRYADFAAWQQNRVSSLSGQAGYWRDRLAGLPPAELPTDHARPPVRSGAGASHVCAVPFAGLRAVAREHRVTPFMLLVAATQVLLGRYTGQSDLAVATAVAERGRPETDHLTGLLVNTVILRATVSDDEPFVSLLHRVRDTTLEAFEHAELPFQHVVETLNLDRDPSRPPLAEVSVALHGAPLDHEIVPGLHLRELRPPTPVSTMDIAVDAYDLGDTLELRLTYNTELFTAPTIERFGAHLSRLLAGIAAAPDTPVGDLPMTTATEAHVLTELWPREGVGQRPRTIVELFADQVRRTPDAVAVVADEGLATPATLSGLPGRATASPDGTEPPGSPLPEAPAGRISLTYAQLDTLSTRLAHLLAARGAGPERIVALALPRGVDLVVAELAVARTGAAFLPLDGDNPPERLRLMLDDARPVLLVTGSGFPHDLGYSPVLHLSHPGVAVQLSAGSVAPLAVAVTVGHAAYVIFTSGSTGRPKGVVVTHRGVHGLVAAQSARFRTGEGSRVLRFASPAFDAAFSELGMALFTGGAVVVAGKEAMLPGEPLAGLVSRQGVTHVTLPPSALPALRPDAFPRDLVLVVAGEACPPALAAQWAGRHRVVNAYGPTESTVCATMSEPLDGTSVPMGRPLDGVRTYVLDGRLRAVPVGVPGELYLGGAALARGYLGRAGLTAASFVAHPGGERLYRTGDRVRWRADGNLEYLGRTDDQVKLRGFRVEPGEVEAALSTHPEVRAAAVVVRADHLGTRRLVGYAVTPAAVAPRLRDYLRERLPEHMVPAVVVALDELPRTPNGKVDRRALPEPPRQELSARVAPRTDVERVLADIWAGLLGIEVGVTDNFFDLGGDSILGLRVVARARDAGLHLTARHTFLRQTIAELAREATPLARAGSVDTPVTGPVRATPIIRWFQETLVASRDRFNQAVLVELPADTDAVALDTALRALVRHHDALRLRMPDAAAGSPLVHAQPGDEPVLREPHLHPDQVREATLAAQLGFDLVRGPLFRATLFRAGTTRLHLVAHHLVVDGISWRVLLADLDTAYRQVLGGQPVDLGAKTTSFQDWAERLAEHTAAGGFDHELPHWQAVEAAAVAALPVDGHGPNTVEHARTVTVRLTAPETEALLRAVPPVYRTQVNDVLLSALAHSLRQWSGGSTARIALEGHGREDLFAEVDLSRTVGWFTTVYPVLLSLPDGDWGQVLKAVKEQLRAVPGNGIGYGALRHLAGAGLTGGPEVSFNYLGRLDESRDLLPTEGAERAPHQERHHLIEVNGEVSGGQLTFDLTYASTRHHEHTVRALADGFTAALREIIAHCARPGAGGATPSDFPLAALDQSTVDRLVGDGRAVSDLYPLTPGQSGMLFHSLAEAGRDLYTGHFGVRLDGITDPAALAEAWRAAVARTPALRSAVVWQDVPEPLQVVHTTAELPITHHDLSTLDGDAQAAALAELWRRQRRTVLDLATAPLLRLTIVRLSGTAVQLFWSSHHLVLDGWSFTHLLTDVLALHAGTTPVTRRPYREHVRRLAELDPAEAEKHWRGVVGDLTAPTPLPLDRAPARAHDTRSSVELTHRLSTTDTTRLLEVARAQRVTLNTLVQGAWAVLLARHGGDRDVCFGATVSGRADGEEIIGLFINTVPVRVRVEEDRAAADWLRELQHAQAAGRDHEHVALSQIQRWSGVPAGTGLFDSIVVFENYPYDHEAAARQGVRIGEYLGDEHTNYALTLTAHLTGDLHLSLGYDPDLLRAASAQTLLDRLRTVLLGLARAPEAPLGRLRLHTGADVVPGADIAYGPPGLVHELFAAQAARTPDAIAVTGPDGELGFAELDRRANRLAHRLRALGARPGVLVGVCLARGAAAVVALLGVLKSGAAFVPLDPAHPSQRLRVMLEDAAAPIVVTDARHLHLAGDAVTVLLEDPGLAAEPATAPASGACPADLAYVCYTSGTTGRPKGVLVEHRHVHHMVRAWDTRHGLAGTAPVALNVSSLSVDLFLGDFLLSALFGGRLVVCPQDQVADQVALTDLLLDSGATLMVTVPALARAMAAELRWRGVRPEALRLLLVGSEGFATEAAREILDALAPGATLVNAYGSTETTVDSTHFPADPDTLGEAAFTPVGHVLANTWIAVLDDRLRPVPPGVTGECYIGGDGVSRGYHDRPGLTSGRFVADPCRPGKRLYRTGDLVRVRADGALECLGRVDDQVKVGGFRVELGEVEAALDRHPAVRAAAARLVRTEAGTRLVGYVVGEGLDLKAVKEFVTAALPPAAVPALLVELPALPLTTSGTVDRRALPVPGAAQVARTAFVAPRSSTERVLAQVWAEVLGVPRVGVHDNFFELGGDSVLSIRVISRLRSALGVAPSPRQLFDTPTVAGLAGVLGTDSGPRTGPGRAVGAGAPGGPLAGPVRLAGDGPAPLSFAQLRMWFHQEFAPESAEYNIVTALEIEGALEESALRAALTAVVARHDTLRTTYTTVAEVRPPSAVPLPVREVAEAGVETAVRALAAEPFDLRTGPVLRAELLRIAPERHVLALVVHHIAVDGRSFEVLLADLATAYSGAPLPPVALRHSDFTHWQQAALDDSEQERHLAYWVDRLAGAPVLELPLDHPRPPVRQARGGLHLSTLDPAVARALRGRADGTLFMTLLASVQVLLARWCGQTDLVIGIPSAGRAHRELEDLVGLFVNTLAIRSTVDRSLSFTEHLARVRETLLAAFTHEDVPFDRVVEALRPRRDPSRNAVVEVFVGLETSRGTGPGLPGLTVRELPLVSPDVSHDLSFDFVDGPDGLQIAVGYGAALFEPGTIEDLSGQLHDLLARIARTDFALDGLVPEPGESAPVDEVTQVAHVAPRTESERVLAGIWAEVLGTRVGVHDNFFDLGGDSLLSIQAVQRARQAGLTITTREMFLHQTVAALAEAASTPVEAAPVFTGPAPLTPVQHAFLAGDPVAPHHFTQSTLLELHPEVDPDRLAEAVNAVFAHHEVLRTRFTRVAGQWRQEPAEPRPLPLERHDLADLDRAAAAADASLDLGSGELVRALLFTGDGPSKLFLTVHHLVVDAVSWRILLADLESAYQGRALPPVTASLGQWAAQLVAQPPSDLVVDPLPRDGDGPHLTGDTTSVSVTVDEESTELLLRKAAGRFRARAEHVLLAALTRVLTAWTGRDSVVVDLEGHGRDGALDLSRSVGWFTVIHPVRLTAADSWRDQVRGVRDHLRDRRPGPRAEVVFNYHGRVEDSAPDSPLYRAVLPPVGRERDPRAPADHLLEVVALVRDGELRLDLHHSPFVHHPATVTTLAGALKAALHELAEEVRGAR